MFSAIPLGILPKLEAGEISLEAWLHAAHHAGFDAVEFFEGAALSPSRSRIRLLSEELGKLHLKVSMVTAYTDFAAPEPRALRKELAHVLGLCQVAKALGAPLIRVFPGFWPTREARLKVLKRCASGLREAVALAHEEGVLLALENHPDIGTSISDFCLILEEVGDVRLKINLDTSNFHFFEPGVDYTRLLQFRDQIACVHFKDIDSELKHVPIGKGVVQFGEILPLIPYDAVYSVESSVDCLAALWEAELRALKTLLEGFQGTHSVTSGAAYPPNRGNARNTVPRTS